MTSKLQARRPPTNKALADPVQFASHFLGAKLWPLQAEILRSVVTNRRTAAASCHSSGKTYLSSIASLFWLFRWPDSRVIIISPGYTQLRTVLFAELHRHLRRMRYDVALDQNRTEIRLSPTNYILGIATNDATRLQGHHAAHLLLIVDEAVGVAGEIWEGAESLLASGDAHILCVSNPTVTDGAFYQIFTRERAAWNLFTIDAFSTPNFSGIAGIDGLLALPDAELDHNPWPMLITRRWVRDRYRAWFNDDVANSPLWASRILGQFPSQSENALIPLNLIEKAQVVDASFDGTELVAGIDVAAGGADRTVLTILTRDATAARILEQRSWSVADARGVLVAALNNYRGRLRTIAVDQTGVGFHLVTHLRDLGFPVRGVNFGSSPVAVERFVNCKAEIYWGLREMFRSGMISGVSDELAGELATLRYELDSKGRTLMESKDALRARGQRSPDLADSLALALSGAASRDRVQEMQRWNQDDWERKGLLSKNDVNYRAQSGLLLNPGQSRPVARSIIEPLCDWCHERIVCNIHSWSRIDTGARGVLTVHTFCIADAKGN